MWKPSAKPKTFKELKNLNNHKKKDYFENILFQDAKMDAYIENQQIQIAKLAKEMKDIDDDIDSELDEWNENLESINDRMMEKMFSNGISKKLFDARMKKLKEFKDVCIKCVQGKACRVHDFKIFMAEQIGPNIISEKEINKFEEHLHKRYDEEVNL